MISITKLLMDAPNYGDQLRYEPKAHECKNGVAPGRGPVVVWNCTKTCNLSCVHCYARSEAIKYQNELTHETGELCGLQGNPPDHQHERHLHYARCGG